MPLRNPLIWIRTTRGAKLGYHYSPGSSLRNLGVEDKYYELTSEWSRIGQDAAKAMEVHFGDKVEVNRRRY
jgi:hypothetical protein